MAALHTNLEADLPTMGRLSTHVLDTAAGKPARNVAIELRRRSPDGTWHLVKSTTTNADGRTDQPVLAGDDYVVGTYELTFHVGDYFRPSGTKPTSPAFLEDIPIRFSITEPDGHYHVPLLVSPWSYSTYRGS